MEVRLCAVPHESRLQAFVGDADFHDAYSVSNPHPERPALALWLQTLERPPRWVDAAMRVRNAIVKRLGLKDLGAMAQIDLGRDLRDYRVGQRVGIFTVLHLSEDEVVMGDDDKHLEATQGVNPGRSKAEEAARAVGGKLLLPIFAPGEQAANPKGFTDFNDLATKSVLGQEGIARQVRSVVDDVIEWQRGRSVEGRARGERQEQAVRRVAKVG